MWAYLMSIQLQGIPLEQKVTRNDRLSAWHSWAFDAINGSFRGQIAQHLSFMVAYAFHHPPHKAMAKILHNCRGHKGPASMANQFYGSSLQGVLADPWICLAHSQEFWCCLAGPDTNSKKVIVHNSALVGQADVGM
eukprot:gnl/TRDRNA2_/TRDRNA2_177384_c2_seq4.p2 gnl/TRDRNA2_/TRDRNA2_177384_c2~~gnl/TRDRNA2_/TRDRNA2_177384_c2_seq4.p2  ORF type:complete len:136 (-),score=13.96 gnl/TRDRNA2_/TRDRNA2_177384_c2_seq4:80-487(-)